MEDDLIIGKQTECAVGAGLLDISNALYYILITASHKILETTMEMSRRRISRRSMFVLLDQLATMAGSAVSLYMTPGSPIREIEQMLGRVPELEEALSDIAKTVFGSPTGAVLYWGEEKKLLIVPPFPVQEKHLSAGYDVEALRLLLQQELTIAVILVRLGAYAIGVFEGEELISGKAGTGNIHGRHRKGGSSARRFERHREKQMEYFFDRVCSHVRELVEPNVKQLNYVIYGGERNTLLAFQKACPFLEIVADRTLGRRLDIHDPRRSTLQLALKEVWSSSVHEWRDNDFQTGRIN